MKAEHEHNSVDVSSLSSYVRGAAAAIQDVEAVCDEVLESTVAECVFGGRLTCVGPSFS